jgi:hypothetical protein
MSCIRVGRSRTWESDCRETDRNAEASLGKLVKFVRRTTIARDRAAPLGAGQILIFTGVRYERNEAPLPGKNPTSTRPKRKRG